MQIARQRLYITITCASDFNCCNSQELLQRRSFVKSKWYYNTQLCQNATCTVRLLTCTLPLHVIQKLSQKRRQFVMSNMGLLTIFIVQLTKYRTTLLLALMCHTTMLNCIFSLIINCVHLTTFTCLVHHLL